MEVEYQNPYTCNSCGGKNLVDGNLRVGEAKTKCVKCGFDDYWCYGYFESSEHMYSNSKKYTSKTCPF